jgi:uncharacterized protein (TIGR03118 family)
MKTIYPSIKTVLIVFVTLSSGAVCLEADTYSWNNLRSDIPGVAANVDSNIVNPWGLTASASGVIWVSDNGTGVSTLYRQDGTPVPNAASPLIVSIPTSAKNKGEANPTGVVVNGTASFKVSQNGNSQPARFIFVSEDGSISGWNPTVDATHAILAVDNSKGGSKTTAVYKGVTLGMAKSQNFLYATNFNSGRVETYDENFHQVNLTGFVDPNLPAGYAPFGIRNLNDQIYVTYAKQDKKRTDDVGGPGNGFVDVFDPAGNFIKRLVSNGNLNSPWGLALVDDELWVGNFGDGTINVYDPNTGAFIETVSQADGTPLQFDGLWDMLPLPGGIYFTAGIADEEHGLFGVITED